MANTLSSKKQARVRERRRLINKTRVVKFRKEEKKIRSLLADGNKEEATKELPALFSALDKAAKKGAIHKNKANRTKSHVAKLLAKA